MSRLKIDSPGASQVLRPPERKEVSIAVPQGAVTPGSSGAVSRQPRDTFESAAPALGSQRKPSSGSVLNPGAVSPAVLQVPLAPEVEPYRNLITGIGLNLASNPRLDSDEKVWKAIDSAYNQAKHLLPADFSQVDKFKQGIYDVYAAAKGPGIGEQSYGAYLPANLEWTRPYLDNLADQLAKNPLGSKRETARASKSLLVDQLGLTGQDKQAARRYLSERAAQLQQTGGSAGMALSPQP
jgi:hypothetical protein